MPVLLVNAASTSSSAFFIEAAAKTVMVLSCATAEERGLASPMPSAAAARNLRVRSSILALLEAAAAPARCRAALRHVVRPQVCQEATNPEAPFRGSGALTARHGPRRKSSRIVFEGKGVRRLSRGPRATVRSSPRGAPRDARVAGTPLRGPSFWPWIPACAGMSGGVLCACRDSGPLGVCPQPASLTVSQISVSVASGAAWATRERRSESGHQSPSHRCNRVWNVAFRPQRRILWAGNLRVRQIAGRAWWHDLLRGESFLARRSGIRRPQYKGWRDGGSHAIPVLQNVPARPPA